MNYGLPKKMVNMKNSLLILLCSVAVSNAAIVKFNLSPPGSDSAVGLSPLNETHAVTNSSGTVATGSGDTVSGGILFDTATSTLQLAVGYGSAAGFSDLTGPPTAMHIHGPAPVGQPAGVVVSLAPLHFPHVNPANGGLILGTVIYSTNDVAALLGGSNYINIHTALNPGGELRAQLIPDLNDSPLVECSAATVVECGQQTTTTISVSDPEGDALVVVWSLNGSAVQTNLLASGAPGVSTNVSFSGDLPLGTNTLAVSVSDTATNVTECETTIVVVDTTPPVIIRAAASPNSLWPPNHKLVAVRVSAMLRDNCGSTKWKITSITSNEPQNGLGDGDTDRDWRITGEHTAQLRAERSGKGNGRIYTITIVGEDASGNKSEARTVTVTVPKSQSARTR